MKSEKKYGSYMLAAKTKYEIINIDWTKVKAFEKLKNKRYKLEQIDFFTQHFMDRESLIKALIDAKVVKPEEIEDADFWIFQVRKDDNSPDGIALKPDGQLKYGIAFRAYAPLFSSDAIVIQTLQEHLTDYEFMKRLYNKYVLEGSYSKHATDGLRLKIDDAEKSQRLNFDETGRQGNILNAYYAQLRQMEAIQGLLTSMLAYAGRSTHTANETESARNNAEEFFMRIKYNVIKATYGINDSANLVLKTNKDGKYAVKYFEYHQLLMFLGRRLDAELGAQAQSNIPITSPLNANKRKIKKRRKDPIEGQTSLFDNDDNDVMQSSMFDEDFAEPFQYRRKK